MWRTCCRFWVVSCFETCFRRVLWNQISMVHPCLSYIFTYFLMHSWTHIFLRTDGCIEVPNFGFFRLNLGESRFGSQRWVATAHVSRIWSAMVKVVNACLGQVIWWKTVNFLRFFQGGKCQVSTWIHPCFRVSKNLEPSKESPDFQSWKMGTVGKISLKMAGNWHKLTTSSFQKNMATTFRRKVRRREYSNGRPTWVVQKTLSMFSLFL